MHPPPLDHPGSFPLDTEALRRQQESLRRIIELISRSRDLRSLLTQIVQLACELIGAERGTIGLVDEARDLVRTEAVYRMPPGELGAEMRRGEGLAGGVLASQAPLILDRYGELDMPVQRTTLEDAVIGMPIFWQGRMIGFFGIGALPPRRFDERDVETLAFFAHHAAIAITNAQLFAQTQRALDEASLLYETSRRISNAVDVDEVIDAYLEQVAARGHYACHIVLYERGAPGEPGARVTRGRWTPQGGLTRLAERQPHNRDALDRLLDLGQSVLIADVSDDPRVPPPLRDMQVAAGRPSLAMIPLLAVGQRIGLVVLSDTVAHEWSDADLWLYQTTATQLAASIDSRRQQRLLYERGQQLAVLEERHRLARELHDSVTQLLFSITLIAQSIAPAWRRDPDEGAHRVGRLLELSQSALAEMRALLAELHPPSEAEALPPTLRRVHQEGLVAALRRHLAELERDGLPVVMEVEGIIGEARLPLAQEEALFRIAQEALHNVLKHAGCCQTTLRLAIEGKELLLSVQDDGAGFDPATGQAGTGGMGLRGIVERGREAGGAVEIRSAPGQGTAITVRLPWG